jgi:short-subunit dehydrogenase
MSNSTPSGTKNPPGTVIITGASSGIGAAFARHLGALGYRLILVARRREHLQVLSRELNKQYNTASEILVSDLSRADGMARVEKKISELKNLVMLVNNAGFGTTGKFYQIELDKQIEMINLHVTASVRLCRAALPGMIANGLGSIINVSSIAAYIPSDGNANYCASKAYLKVFSEALQAELRNTGIRVQALCPGLTYTEFHDTPEYHEFNRSRFPRILWMSAEELVSRSLKALKKNRVTYIPGLVNRLLIIIASSPLLSLIRAFMSRRKKPA